VGVSCFLLLFTLHNLTFFYGGDGLSLSHCFLSATAGGPTSRVSGPQ